ncbi:hypothetical protein KR52_01355 [Synechococcus sp. KORDI-52]|uniref:SIMPL domain-containing protein n=1 Tax=Synechococcus sp. KORDI-52 TaxID=585425 RepID=UPI0004E06025|nr:SIMPL domain-containing protein [Synechococcus sp. KORDI-52]AII47810.1 hypothetical protein KR52_01355 [Synechococcus sp. KORDI-52]
MTKSVPRSPEPCFARLRAGVGIAAPVLLGLTAMAPPPMKAAERDCKGTLLQIQVNERGTTRSDRFRFSLGLDAEEASKEVATRELNARLAQARQAIQPLAMGRLTIPAPRSSSVGGGTLGPRRERVSTTITGEVSRDQYDALMQAAARLPGVRLQGMTSLASIDGSASLVDQLLKQALETGQRRAQATARALGLRKVDLLLIDQRGSAFQPVRMAARMGPANFRPGEAPKPSQSLTLKLDYCLR